MRIVKTARRLARIIVLLHSRGIPRHERPCMAVIRGAVQRMYRNIGGAA